jgi:hypothetical protein
MLVKDETWVSASLRLRVAAVHHQTLKDPPAFRGYSFPVSSASTPSSAKKDGGSMQVETVGMLTPTNC